MRFVFPNTITREMIKLKTSGMETSKLKIIMQLNALFMKAIGYIEIEHTLAGTNGTIIVSYFELLE